MRVCKEFIGGILLSVLSAVAFIAYKHPKAYKEYIYPWKIFLFTAIAAVVWDFVITRSYEFFSPYFAPEKANEALIAAESTKILSWPLVAIFGGLFFYFTFLRMLPFMLEKDKPVEKKGNEEGE